MTYTYDSQDRVTKVPTRVKKNAKKGDISGSVTPGQGLPLPRPTPEPVPVEPLPILV
jgi:hypothetical protein